MLRCDADQCTRPSCKVWHAQHGLCKCMTTTAVPFNHSSRVQWLQNAQNISYKYGFAAQEWIQYPGGLFKASSTANFPASTSLSGGLFKLNPGGMREMHWHNPNEWGFVVNGTCRATLVNQGSTHMVESCRLLLISMTGHFKVTSPSGCCAPACCQICSQTVIVVFLK